MRLSCSLHFRGSDVSNAFTESEVEQAALSWFSELAYVVELGAQIAPGEEKAERGDYHEIVLACRLREALDSLNPELSADVLEGPSAGSIVPSRRR
jgi:type I restriction enzyme R subunit